MALSQTNISFANYDLYDSLSASEKEKQMNGKIIISGLFHDFFSGGR